MQRRSWRQIAMARTTALRTVGLIVAMSGSAEGATWFKFNQAFVTSSYTADQAFGSVTAAKWVPAGSPHSISCDGQDGELHVGAFETKLTLPTGQSPLSAYASGVDSHWGLVAELPNAAASNGPSTLQGVLTHSISFEGYYRVWNEGHDHGPFAASNPHHVFEVHPAWGFSSGTTHFENRSLIKSIAGFRGYRATKVKPVLSAIKAGQWSRGHVAGGELFVQVERAENFYQLPVKVTSIGAIPGGHVVSVDVFSDKLHTHLVYSNLACIASDGSPFDAALGQSINVGDLGFFLGFFSINLKKALNEAAAATSVDTAVETSAAVEFFVFGRATSTAVASCTTP